MKIFVVLFLLTLSTMAKAQNKICVLSLFQKNTTLDKIVYKAYHKSNTNVLIDKNIDLYREADINTINHCFDSENYSEIVFVAHGSSTRTGLTDYSMPILQNSLGQYQMLQVRYFQMLSKKLANNKNIKKLRISVCGVNFDPTNKDEPEENIHSTIDILVNSAIQNNVEIDISKKFIFGSWALKENVTRLKTTWLRRSINDYALQAYYKEARCKHQARSTCH